MSDPTPLLPTVGEIARRFDVPLHRVEYAIRAQAIRPAGMAGNARVFDDGALAQIASALGLPAVNELAVTGTTEATHAS